MTDEEFAFSRKLFGATNMMMCAGIEEALRRMDAATAELAHKDKQLQEWMNYASGGPRPSMLGLADGPIEFFKSKNASLWNRKNELEAELAKRDAELKAARRHAAENVCDSEEIQHCGGLGDALILEWAIETRDRDLAFDAELHPCGCGRGECRGNRCEKCWQDVISVLEQRKNEP